MILASIKGALIALFILFMFFGWLFQTINRIREGIEKNKRIRKKGKLNPQSNPFEQESAEDFFARMDQPQEPEKPKRSHAKKAKPALKPRHQSIGTVANEEAQSLPSAVVLDNLAEQEAYKLPEVKSARAMNDKKSGKSKNIVDKKNLKNIRKAIILNEVLGRPKAYDL